MRTAIILMAMLVGSLPLPGVCRDSAVASLELRAEPIRARTPRGIHLSAAGEIISGRVNLKNSVLRITDATGRIVSKIDSPFWFPKATPSSTSSWSTSGGVEVPKALHSGDYTAVWSVDGIDSNPASFSITDEPPPSRLLSPYEHRRSKSCMILHVFNSRSEAINLPNSILAAKLMIDGKVHVSNAVSWDGGPYLGKGKGYGWAFHPRRQFRVNSSGKHIYSVEFAGEWSNKVEVECPD
jgi:hypothetical protein